MTSDKHTARRRREILAAAEKVFSAWGYAATKMDDVAAAAGLSKGSPYNYFRSKRDLFTQLFNEAFAADEADVDCIVAVGVSAAERLNRILDMWGRRLEYFIHMGGLMLEFWAAARRDESGELAGVLEELYRRWRGRIAAVVADGVSAGEFSTDVEPMVAASMIAAVTDGIIVQSIMGMGVNVDEAFLAALKRNILGGLTARPKRTASNGAGEDNDEHREE